MKCLKHQKGRTCPKQPGNAPALPKGTRLCTGCDGARAGIDKAVAEFDRRSVAPKGYRCVTVLSKAILSNGKPRVIARRLTFKAQCKGKTWAGKGCRRAVMVADAERVRQ